MTPEVCVCVCGGGGGGGGGADYNPAKFEVREGEKGEERGEGEKRDTRVY